jgi:hypothetical protein
MILKHYIPLVLYVSINKSHMENKLLDYLRSSAILIIPKFPFVK